MKWRHSLIYLMVLLILGGYYYYFEVIRKEQKQAAEQESKRVFHFNVDSLRTLEISPKDKKPVVLKKEQSWTIMSPIETQADGSATGMFVSALAGLEEEKEISTNQDDLNPFALEVPSVTIRFQTGEQWSELLLGDKSPTGEGHYARTKDNGKVFLIGESSWSALDKGLDELRRRELFAFQTEEVKGIQVDWAAGARIRIEKAGEGGGWKVPEQPDIKVKESKVENLLDQLHWLRAQSFLEEGAQNLESNGLKPPYVSVALSLKNGGNVELLLGPKSDRDKQLAALSSELPAVVRVDATVLDDLPKDAASLEDRSILGLNVEDVKGVKWLLGDSQGHVVELARDKWGIKEGDKEPQALKEPWRTASLLWDLHETEYLEKVSPTPPVPGEPFGRIELLDGANQLLTYTWEKIQSPSSNPQVLWMEQGGRVMAVKIPGEALVRIEQEIAGITQPLPEADKRTP